LVAQVFYTSATDNRGTSKYFIYPNGVIRAKTAEGQFHIRPGKNICFIRDDDAHLLNSGIQEVIVLEDDRLRVISNDRDILEARYTPDVTYNTPLDFFFEADGSYSGRHIGHMVAPIFNGGDSGITEADIDRQEPDFVNAERTEITAPRGNVAINTE